MKSSSQIIFPWLLVCLLGFTLAGEYWLFRENQITLTRARAEFAEAANAHAPNESLRKLQEQADELEQLRTDNAEFHRLIREILALRQGEKTNLETLRQQNAKLQEENQRLENDPATAEARQVFEASQLLQIAQTFIQYAGMNSNRIPADFSELQPFAAAQVFAGFETNRYEIVASGNWSAIQNPNQTVLLRSRQSDKQGQRIYLYADGHTEIRKELP